MAKSQSWGVIAVRFRTDFMENITELEQSKMKVVQEMAAINMLISEGKAELLKLENNKNIFIEEREVALIKKINAILAGSDTILNKAKENYAEVHEFYLQVKECVEFLKGANADFQKMVEDFKEKTAEQEDQINKRVAELSELEKSLKNEAESIKKDKEFMAERKKEIQKDQIYINDQRETLKRALERLKNNKK